MSHMNEKQSVKLDFNRLFFRKHLKSAKDSVFFSPSAEKTSLTPPIVGGRMGVRRGNVPH